MISVIMHTVGLILFSIIFFNMGAFFIIKNGIPPGLKNLENIQKKREVSEKSLIIEIKKYDDMFFVYDERSNFILQALTTKELETRLIQMYPDTKFLSDTEGLHLLYGERNDTI